MLGILGKIFGSEKVIDSGMKAIDALVFTDEEKSKAKLTLLKAYEPFKLAQRYLSLIFAALFSASFLVALTLELLGKSYDGVIAVVEAFGLGQIMLAIVGFYFLGGVVSGGFGKTK